jgi:cytochrome c oxidase subunit 2
VRRLAIVACVLLVACGDKNAGYDEDKVRDKPLPKHEPPPPPPPSAALGEVVYLKKGCTGCHSIDGSPRIGPSFKGVAARALSGATKFSDGTFAKDLIGDGKPYPDVAAYLADQFLRPNQHVVAGYPPSAPAFEGVLKPYEVDSVVLYMQSLE